MPVPEAVVALILIEQAMWQQDLETLDAVAQCRCCCEDHTYTTCMARLWGGCRSHRSYGQKDDEQ